MFIRNAVMDLVQRRTLLPERLDAALAGPGRDVSDLTIVVTGASAGIGRQAVTQLRARGATVIAVARREDELRTLAAETGCSWRTCDLADQAATARLLADLADERVDVLVNNAGHSIRRSIADATDRLHDYQRTMSLNYLAAVQLSLGLLPGMIERGHGSVVNVSTMAATTPAIATVDPDERSMPPLMMMNIMPEASMPVMAIWRRRLEKLRAVRNDEAPVSGLKVM